MAMRSRIRNLFRGDRLNREIDEEMEAHILDAIEAGRDPEEARRAFGSRLVQRERSRDAKILPALDGLRADLIFALRQLRKNKAAMTAAVLSLGLAMGACLAAFRIVDALLLRPMPVNDPGSLHVLSYVRFSDGQKQIDEVFDFPQFRRLRDSVSGTVRLAAISGPGSNAVRYGADGDGERIRKQFVSGNAFALLGLKPALGRLIQPADDEKPGTYLAVLSHDYWMRRFGGDPSVVGRTFRIGNEVYEIVGVCQRGFRGTDPGVPTDIFVPTMANARAVGNEGWGWIRIWARPQPGVSAKAALERVRAAVVAWRREAVKRWDPGTPGRTIDEFVNSEVSLISGSAGFSPMQRTYRLALQVLAVLVGLVLLIACANVGNLTTGRASVRAREMALRTAIGAGRARLIRMLIVESALIGAAAATLGAAFARGSIPAVVGRMASADEPMLLHLAFDRRALAFFCVTVLGVTLLFGLGPALRASSARPIAAIRGGDDPHAGRRLMNTLVCVQVGFCALVLFVAGLFAATAHRLTRQPAGFDATGVLTMETVTAGNRQSNHWEDARRVLSAVPGVESAAIAGWPLLGFNEWTATVMPNGRVHDGESAFLLAVSPGWLNTMRIPILGGRDFGPSDGTGKAIVNQTFARRYFEDLNPVGRSFRTWDGSRETAYEIVGLAGDARYRNMRDAIRPTIYLPFAEQPGSPGWATFVVRSSGADPLSLTPGLRQALSAAWPEFRIVGTVTQQELVDSHTARERLLALLAVFFGGVALLLAAVGLYGVLTYSVLQRAKEIGIRIAIGAPALRVASGIAGEAAVTILAGAGSGSLCGRAASRYLESLLFGVKATDTGMLLVPTGVLIAAALLAVLPPAVRAARIDPAAMLRVE